VCCDEFYGSCGRLGMAIRDGKGMLGLFHFYFTVVKLIGGGERAMVRIRGGGAEVAHQSSADWTEYTTLMLRV
jgi:hypothetical protein